MFEDVKICVTARVDFFEKYYEIPRDIESEVSSLITEINALGEDCANSAEFEERFVSTGLSDKFNSVLPKCTPKAIPVTTEQKEYSKQVRHEMWEEQKGQIGKDIINDVTESVLMRAESDAIAARRKAMTEAGVYDDYTRASNMVDNAKYAGNFLSKLFKKKK